jgi:hypothetical protein
MGKGWDGKKFEGRGRKGKRRREGDGRKGKGEVACLTTFRSVVPPLANCLSTYCIHLYSLLAYIRLTVLLPNTATDTFIIDERDSCRLVFDALCCVCCDVKFVPQECTRDTSGLLYFDLLSSKMYRCSGREWQEWGYGTAGGDGFQYTALLKDAAAAASSSSTESSRGADDDNENEDPTPDNENDDETAASNQANTKKRKGQCKAG